MTRQRILTAIKSYLLKHPDLTHQQVEAALENVAGYLVEGNDADPGPAEWCSPTSSTAVRQAAEQAACL